MMRELIKRAKDMSQILADEANSERYPLIRAFIREVRVLDDGIRILVDRHSIRQQLQVIDDDQAEHDKEEKQIVLEIAAELKRLGREKKLIVAAHAPVTNADPVLIKAIVKAHKWFAMLKSGDLKSISEIARLEDAPRTYISRLIPLAFLAPDITEAILSGRQPVALTLDRLLDVMPLPLAWQEQRKILDL